MPASEPQAFRALKRSALASLEAPREELLYQGRAALFREPSAALTHHHA